MARAGLCNFSAGMPSRASMRVSAVELEALVDRAPGDQFGENGAAGDSGAASIGLELGGEDLVSFHAKVENEERPAPGVPAWPVTSGDSSTQNYVAR